MSFGSSDTPQSADKMPSCSNVNLLVSATKRWVLIQAEEKAVQTQIKVKIVAILQVTPNWFRRYLGKEGNSFFFTTSIFRHVSSATTVESQNRLLLLECGIHHKSIENVMVDGHFSKKSAVKTLGDHVVARYPFSIHSRFGREWRLLVNLRHRRTTKAQQDFVVRVAAYWFTVRPIGLGDCVVSRKGLV